MVIGGAGSGKSKIAEQFAADSGEQVVFIATGKPVDEEMRVKIENHKQSRPVEWQTIELNRAFLSEECSESCFFGKTVVIDCITFYLAELIEKLDKENIINEFKKIIQPLKEKTAQTIIVTNELGMGIVPSQAQTREFRDIHGTVNQIIASEADEVYMAVAGLPVKIK